MICGRIVFCTGHGTAARADRYKNLTKAEAAEIMRKIAKQRQKPK